MTIDEELLDDDTPGNGLTPQDTEKEAVGKMRLNGGTERRLEVTLLTTLVVVQAVVSTGSETADPVEQIHNSTYTAANQKCGSLHFCQNYYTRKNYSHSVSYPVCLISNVLYIHIMQ